MQPIGPESPGVYWVRRAALLVIVLLLLFGLIWVFRAVTGSSSTQTPIVEPAVALSESVDPQVGLTPVTTDPLDRLDSAILVAATSASSTTTVRHDPF